MRRMTYLPQLEQEQLEPQLPVRHLVLLIKKRTQGMGFWKGKDIQLDEPEHPHSPFMMVVVSGGW